MDMSAYNSYEQLRATEFRLGRASRNDEIAQLQSKLTEALAANEQNLKVYHAAAAELRQQLVEAQQQVELGKAFTGQFFVDIERLEQQLNTAWAQAHRLALELECLIIDTKDNAIVSKWWDSGMEALSEYQELKSGAKEEAEAWAKMRKAGI